MKQKIAAAILAAETLVDNLSKVKDGLTATGVTDPRDPQYQLADDAEMGAKWTLDKIRDLDATVSTP